MMRVNARKQVGAEARQIIGSFAEPSPVVAKDHGGFIGVVLPPFHPVYHAPFAAGPKRLTGDAFFTGGSHSNRVSHLPPKIDFSFGSQKLRRPVRISDAFSVFLLLSGTFRHDAGISKIVNDLSFVCIVKLSHIRVALFIQRF